MSTATEKLLELVRAKKQQIQTQTGRREKATKPITGKNVFRILPSWRGEKSDGQFWHDFGQHYIKGLDGVLKAVYICTQKTYDKPCSICDGLGKAIHDASDDETINLLKEARSSSRILVNALNRSAGSETPNVPVILELSPTTFEKIMELWEMWQAEGIDITALDSGMDIIINRSGKGLLTKYDVQAAPKSATVNASILKDIHNLDDYVAQESDSERVKALTAVHAVVGLLGVTAIGSSMRTVSDDEEFESGDSSLRDLEIATTGKGKFSKAEIVDAETEVAVEDDELASLLADL